jgi:hypothetical protein
MLQQIRFIRFSLAFFFFFLQGQTLGCLLASPAALARNSQIPPMRHKCMQYRVTHTHTHTHTCTHARTHIIHRWLAVPATHIQSSRPLPKNRNEQGRGKRRRPDRPADRGRQRERERASLTPAFFSRNFPGKKRGGGGGGGWQANTQVWPARTHTQRDPPFACVRVCNFFSPLSPRYPIAIAANTTHTQSCVQSASRSHTRHTHTHTRAKKKKKSPFSHSRIDIIARYPNTSAWPFSSAALAQDA